MFKTLTIAAIASVALASTASANFSLNEMSISGSTAELGQFSANGAGTVEVFEFHRGEKGALLGTTDVTAGANLDVRVKLGTPPVNDVLAVLTVDGEIVDMQEIDLDR